MRTRTTLIGIALCSVIFASVACDSDDPAPSNANAGQGGSGAQSGSSGSGGSATGGSAGSGATAGSGGTGANTTGGAGGSGIGGSSGMSGSAGAGGSGTGGSSNCPGDQIGCSPSQVAWVTNPEGYGVALFFGQVSCYVSGATIDTTTGVYFQRSMSDELTVKAPENFTFTTASAGTISNDSLTVAGLGLDGALSFALADTSGNTVAFSSQVDNFGVAVSTITYTAQCMP